MELFTKRCLIRPFEENDLEDFMHYRNNPDWMKYQIYKCQDKETYKKQLFQPFSFESLNRLAIALKDSNKLIGDLLIKKSENRHWIGYTIAPEYARQGYAYEITRAAIDFLFESGIHEIYAGCERENLASKSLLEKLNFQYLYEDERGYIFKIIKDRHA